MAKEMVKAKPAKEKMEKEKSRATILQKQKRNANLDNNVQSSTELCEARRAKMLRLRKPKAYGRRMRQAKEG